MSLVMRRTHHASCTKNKKHNASFWRIYPSKPKEVGLVWQPRQTTKTPVSIFRELVVSRSTEPFIYDCIRDHKSREQRKLGVFTRWMPKITVFRHKAWSWKIQGFPWDFRSPHTKSQKKSLSLSFRSTPQKAQKSFARFGAHSQPFYSPGAIFAHKYCLLYKGRVCGGAGWRGKRVGCDCEIDSYILGILNSLTANFFSKLRIR